MIARASILAAAFACALTASCTDVGRCLVGEEGCVCDVAGGCDSGLTCVEGLCETITDGVCLDACRYAGDGACDDGGPGSLFSVCALGTDCTDCGARPNPCDDNPAYSVYCPQTPDVAGGQCWGTGTFCSGLNYCDDGEPYACLNGNRYDCATTSCMPNPCTTTTHPTFCPFEEACLPGNANCCFPAAVDCRTATQCGTAWYTCWRGERVDCGTEAPGDERCVTATQEQ